MKTFQKKKLFAIGIMLILSGMAFLNFNNNTKAEILYEYTITIKKVYVTSSHDDSAQENGEFKVDIYVYLDSGMRKFTSNMIYLKAGEMAKNVGSFKVIVDNDDKIAFRLWEYDVWPDGHDTIFTTSKAKIDAGKNIDFEAYESYIKERFYIGFGKYIEYTIGQDCYVLIGLEFIGYA